MNSLLHETLTHYEGIIERGLKTFAEVGNALLAIRDGRLYQESHATFEDYCRDRWGMERAHAYRLIDSAKVLENLSPVGDIPLPTSERQARPLTGLPPEVQREVWREAVETAPNGKVTAARVQAVVATNKKALVSAHPDYDGDEWYTPTVVIEAVRLVLGGIDLDPASCDAAQKAVRAQRYFTKRDNGLDRDWFGRVWLNPPYSMPLIERFVFKLIDEYEIGKVSAAIILTNNSSDTEWFQSLLGRYSACFTRGRLKFWRPATDTFGARQGQTLFYLGDAPGVFEKEFADLGIIVRRV